MTVIITTVQVSVRKCGIRNSKTIKSDSRDMHSDQDLLTDRYNRKYSRTSIARTLMARLPWLFRTRAGVPGKNP